MQMVTLTRVPFHETVVWTSGNCEVHACRQVIECDNSRVGVYAGDLGRRPWGSSPLQIGTVSALSIFLIPGRT